MLLVLTLIACQDIGVDHVLPAILATDDIVTILMSAHMLIHATIEPDASIHHRVFNAPDVQLALQVHTFTESVSSTR